MLLWVRMHTPLASDWALERRDHLSIGVLASIDALGGAATRMHNAS